MSYRIERHDLHGQGKEDCEVYDMPPADFIRLWPDNRPGTEREDWPAVTDVPCPIDRCTGKIRWAEAGYVPGYRICDECGRHFIAGGTPVAPTLILDTAYEPGEVTLEHLYGGREAL